VTIRRLSVLLVALAAPAWACCPSGMWGPLTSPVVSFTRQYPYGGILGNPIEFMFSGHDLDVCLETGAESDDGIRPLQWWINDANGQEVAWGEQFTSLWVRDALGGWDIVFKFYWDPAAAGDYTVYVWAEDNAYLADDDPDAYASKAVYVRPLIDPDTDDYLCGNCDDCQATIKTQFMPETNDATFTLQIKDAAAQVVRTLADEVAQDGMLNGQGWTHRTDTWDGKDDAGQFVPPGVYTVYARWTVPRMEAEAYVYTDTEAITVVRLDVSTAGECLIAGSDAAVAVHGTLQPEGVSGHFVLQIKSGGGAIVRTLADVPSQTGDAFSYTWDGTDDGGNLAEAGEYRAHAEWTVGNVTCSRQSEPFTVDDPEVTIVQPSDGTVGGTVEVHVEVKTRCATLAALRLEAKEQTDVHPTDWVTITSRDPFVPDAGEVVSDERVDGQRVVTYRFNWNTTFAHNFTHALRAVGTFSPGEVSREAQVEVGVKNLVILSVTPPDCFAVGPADPDTGQRDPAPPVISIAVDDNDLSQPMDLELTIRATPEPTTVVRTLSLLNRTGGEYSFQWDAKDDNGADVPNGFYTFEVDVAQPADVDHCSYRSPSIRVIQHSIDFVCEDDAILLDENDRATAIITYGLNELPAAHSVDVRLCDTAFHVQQTASGLSDQVRDEGNPVRLQTLLPDFTQAATDYRALITAADACGASYRDHANKRMLAHNRTRPTCKHKACFEYVLNSEETSYLYRMVRYFYGRASDGTVLEEPHWRNFLDWHWSATSGSSGLRNKPSEEWNNGGSDPYVGGPCPRNLTHVAGERPSKIAPRIIPVYDGADKNMFVWQNPADEPDTTKTHVAYKYPVLTAGGSQVHTENGDSDADPETPAGRQRGVGGKLLIHPDGGQLGTVGCIGIQGYATSVDVEKELQRLFKIRLPKDTNIPLFVVAPAYVNYQADGVLDDWVYYWTRLDARD